MTAHAHQPGSPVHPLFPPPPTEGGSLRSFGKQAEPLAALALPVLVADDFGRVIYVNTAWSELTKLSEERSLGAGWTDVVDTRDVGAVVQFLAGRRSGVREADVTDVRVILDGRPRWTRWWSNQYGPAGRTVCIADIHDDKTQEAALLERATHDSLTGLVNRSQFLTLVGQALTRTDGQHTIAVVFVDLDQFKEVNDVWGHQTGDRVLAVIAERLQCALRPEDVVGRVGGDEFAILCRELATADEARRVIERVLTAIKEPVNVDIRCMIEATAGLAFPTASGEAPEALVARADADMYSAKRRRRTGSEGYRHGEAPPASSASIVERADRFVQHAFHTAMELHATASRMGQPEQAQIRRALELLDDLVADLRRLVFDHTAQLPSTKRP